MKSSITAFSHIALILYFDMHFYFSIIFLYYLDPLSFCLD